MSIGSLTMTTWTTNGCLVDLSVAQQADATDGASHRRADAEGVYVPSCERRTSSQAARCDPPICSSVRRYVMDKSELLVQHYQDTYQLTYQLWQQRNRLFLILLGVIALASLLTYAPETNSILLSWIGKAVGITDQDRLAAACAAYIASRLRPHWHAEEMRGLTQLQLSRADSPDHLSLPKILSAAEILLFS